MLQHPTPPGGASAKVRRKCWCNHFMHPAAERPLCESHSTWRRLQKQWGETYESLKTSASLRNYSLNLAPTRTAHPATSRKNVRLSMGARSHRTPTSGKDYPKIGLLPRFWEIWGNSPARVCLVCLRLRLRAAARVLSQEIPPMAANGGRAYTRHPPPRADRPTGASPRKPTPPSGTPTPPRRGATPRAKATVARALPPPREWKASRA
jgi:hypothetical protein